MIRVGVFRSFCGFNLQSLKGVINVYEICFDIKRGLVANVHFDSKKQESK